MADTDGDQTENLSTDVPKNESAIVIVRQTIGGILTIICGFYVLYYLYLFFKIGAIDPWPQLIVLPVYIVPLFGVGVLIGLLLLFWEIASGLGQATRPNTPGEEASESIERRNQERP